MDEVFTTVQYCQIASARDRALRLQDRPAVYAWYRRLQLGQEAGDAEQFVAAVNELLAARLSPPHDATLGYLYAVTVQETSGGLSERGAELLEAVSRSADARRELSAILELASPLQAPLYVGKTVSLRRRIADHIAGGFASELKSLLGEAGIRLDQCILRYRYLDNSATLAAAIERAGIGGAASDAVCLLVEELLTRLSPAAFVRRPG
ncbi:GIY-YIG nuclease family protein [Anaeromyxobacter sp. SG17]|uniref:GIY-YIG nuclease family protein n=1 Tax=Anaeromyxobacter sp. SG17 TaxID=2925405 RepID=UPI001F585B0C|nr:GIY-YIG nuclease family protein [Anaeromyxobacter sp. SG17]